MTAGRIALLQDMAVFGAISDVSLEFILAQADTMHLPAGEHFFTEGEEGREMYVLEQGRVELLKQWGDESHRLAELGPGDCFGEMALMDLEPRSATARAVDDCLAIRIPRDALNGLYARDAEQFVLIQMNLGREVSRRLRAADDAIFKARLGEPHDSWREPGYHT